MSTKVTEVIIKYKLADNLVTDYVLANFDGDGKGITLHEYVRRMIFEYEGLGAIVDYSTENYPKLVSVETINVANR